MSTNEMTNAHRVEAEKLLMAVLDCPHTIEPRQITLRIDPTRDGNATAQLHARLAALSAIRAPDVGVRVKGLGDTETIAWNCDMWPDWLSEQVEAAMEVSDRLDMSTEQVMAYAILSTLSPHPTAPEALNGGVTADFHDWWSTDGRFYDPDTSDVPWFDKREALAQYAWDAALSTYVPDSKTVEPVAWRWTQDDINGDPWPWEYSENGEWAKSRAERGYTVQPLYAGSTPTHTGEAGGGGYAPVWMHNLLGYLNGVFPATPEWMTIFRTRVSEMVNTPPTPAPGASPSVTEAQIDAAAIEPFKNDLKGMSLDDIEQAIRNAEDVIDNETPWLEALVAQRHALTVQAEAQGSEAGQ